MRGKTAKRIRKFVTLLMENTETETTKSRRQITSDVKQYWHKGSKYQKFIKNVIEGKDFRYVFEP